MQATELEKTDNYYKTQMQKDRIVDKLKENGCRITKQRMILLDVILSGNCTSCKEIYYKASKLDPKIGTATVYRMVNVLEEIGAISRKNLFFQTDSFCVQKPFLCEKRALIIKHNCTTFYRKMQWNLQKFFEKLTKHFLSKILAKSICFFSACILLKSVL